MRKKTIGWLVGIVVVVLIVLGVGGYAVNGSRTRQLDSAISALRSNNAAKVLPHLTVDDNAMPLTTRNIKPLLTYFQTHPDQLNRLAHVARRGGWRRCTGFGGIRPDWPPLAGLSPLRLQARSGSPAADHEWDNDPSSSQRPVIDDSPGNGSGSANRVAPARALHLYRQGHSRRWPYRGERLC